MNGPIVNRPACCHRRPWWKAAGTALSATLAVFLPKCPMCLAAWFAAGTGIALPSIFTTSLRPLLFTTALLPACLPILHATGWLRSVRRQPR